MSWLGPAAQVGGVQALLPEPCGTQTTGHTIASGAGALPPQLIASMAGMRSDMAGP
jgi:hypothetical protein